MGVKNLWDILESCNKTLPLHRLQNKRVCINLSCWMVQIQNVSKSHSCIKEKVYLKGLFHRLRAFIAVNCTIVFVTDGSIPAIKLSTYTRCLNSGSEVTQDDRNLQNVNSLQRNMGSEFSCMIKEAKVLGMALGIACLDGIEEAEA
ncbi:single-strand DNA endonuclease 1-like [Castanea sativa]|uniref:single-strand DNA endonuclease 1-like n=1 Tax=Castanea sativa TaxID=21020 RepID=UPI003F64F003